MVLRTVSPCHEDNPISSRRKRPGSLHPRRRGRTTADDHRSLRMIRTPATPFPASRARVPSGLHPPAAHARLGPAAAAALLARLLVERHPLDVLREPLLLTRLLEPPQHLLGGLVAAQ